MRGRVLLAGSVLAAIVVTVLTTVVLHTAAGKGWNSERAGRDRSAEGRRSSASFVGSPRRLSTSGRHQW